MSSDSSDSKIKIRLHTERIREAREKRGLSQRQLALLCGFSVAQIYRYEAGTTEPSATIVGAIARELGLTTDYLLGLSDDGQQTAPDALRDDERKLIDAYTTGDLATIIRLVSQRIDTLTGAAEG